MVFEFNGRKRLLIKYKIISLLIGGSFRDELVNNTNRV